MHVLNALSLQNLYRIATWNEQFQLFQDFLSHCYICHHHQELKVHVHLKLSMLNAILIYYYSWKPYLTEGCKYRLIFPGCHTE